MSTEDSNNNEVVDFSQPPKENLVEQYMAARRDVDSRRQPHKLDTTKITEDMGRVIDFCKSLREKDTNKRVEIVLAEFSELSQQFKTLVSAAAKCVYPEEFSQFESLFNLMVSKIAAVQQKHLEMSEATDSVSEVLDTKFVKTVENKQ